MVSADLDEDASPTMLRKRQAWEADAGVYAINRSLESVLIEQ